MQLRKTSKDFMPETSKFARLEKIFYKLKSKELRRGKSWRNLPFWIVTLISSLLFYASFYWCFDAKVAFLTLLVLVIHEAGHAFMMRIFSYQNVRLIFVPFLGAAVIADSPDELKGWKEILMYLMGPLPGIITAVIIYYTAPNTPQTDLKLFAILLIAINTINLLPIVPLDGGMIVQKFINPRRPLLIITIQLFCFIAIASISLVLKSYLTAIFLVPVFLGMLFNFYNLHLLKTFSKKTAQFPGRLEELRSKQIEQLYDRACEPSLTAREAVFAALIYILVLGFSGFFAYYTLIRPYF